MAPAPDTLWPGPPPLSAEEHASLLARLTPALMQALASQRIDPADIGPSLGTAYLPLAAWVRTQRRGGPLVVGVSGAQGSGKSTLTVLLALILRDGFALRVAGFSMDDIYLTRADRERLAQRVHPLLVTRGVPGTHDVALGLGVIAALKHAGPGDVVVNPSFDKAIDDRRPEADWPRHRGAADVIILEGWCVGARPEPDAALARPLNQLEAAEDPDGRWRRYVNGQLQGDYAQLFAQLDRLIMLEVSGMERVFEWRGLQEEKLAQARGPGGGSRIMDPATVRRFVMHYERTTRNLLAELPGRADVVLVVHDDHQVGAIRVNRPG